MALYRTNNSSNLLTALLRVSHTASTSLGEMQCTRYAVVRQNRMKNLHVTSVRRYPDPPILPLPTNISEIFSNETGRFTPERARDIAGPVLLYEKNNCRSFFSEQSKKPTDHLSNLQTCSDTHVDSYDCFGAVSLSGTMQSNVPKPFCSNGKSTHLNMPGGQWARDGKYIAEDMQKSHYRSIRLPLMKPGLTSRVATNILFQKMYLPRCVYSTGYSTKVSQPLNNVVNSEDKKEETTATVQLSLKQRLKIILKDYGVTTTIFHVGISLISLAACYTAVVSGIDIKPIIQSVWNIENEQFKDIISGSSTFFIAYSIHKLLAPLRISITIGVTPILVPYLRKIGILKVEKKKIET